MRSRRIRGALAAGVLAAVCLACVPAGAGAAEPPAPPAGGCPRDEPLLIDAESAPLERLRAEQLRERATGKGVVVAVVDSGVDRRNVHLRKAVLPGKSFIEGDKSKGWTDEFGHGTAIAGVIAARPLDGSGVVGLAPQAKILPVRVFVAPAGNPTIPPENLPRVDRIAAGITWAAQNGADIINVSMSSPTPNPALDKAVTTARKQGALVVASVGNRSDQGGRTEAKIIGDGLRYPAAVDGVLGVTAADLGDGAVPDAVAGGHVDVAAPGSQVLTTYFGAGDCVLASPNSDPPGKTSTSFATGYASGAAALLREVFPRADAQVLAYRLQATASRELIGSRTDIEGWGLVNPLAAMDRSLPDKAADLPPLGKAAAGPTATDPVDTGPVITVAASVDPTEDARQAGAWWIALGAVGLAFALTIGLLTRRHLTFGT